MLNLHALFVRVVPQWICHSEYQNRTIWFKTKVDISDFSKCVFVSVGDADNVETCDQRDTDQPANDRAASSLLHKRPRHHRHHCPAEQNHVDDDEGLESLFRVDLDGTDGNGRLRRASTPECVDFCRPILMSMQLIVEACLSRPLPSVPLLNGIYRLTYDKLEMETNFESISQKGSSIS